MTTAEILHDLRSKGIELWAEGNNLRYRALKGALTAELKLQLAERKAEILTFLGQRAAVSPLNLLSMRTDLQTSEVPLSFSEEGIWLLEQLNPGMTAWNMLSAFRIRGILDIGVFERSLNAMIERQEVLRTAFKLVEGKPVRMVTPVLTIELPVTDVDPLADVDGEIRRVAEEEKRCPFNLAKAPLMRVRLIKIRATEYVLFLSMHHIISDGWSQQILYRELFSLYERFLSGRPSILPTLPIQYSDYAAWVRGSERTEMESNISYWKNKLAGITVAEIPSDKQKLTRRSFCGARQEMKLYSDLVFRLKQIGKLERASLFMVLVAAFNILLYRHTGKTDIVVGSTIAGRYRPEVENIIGFFVNLLVLRNDLSGDPSFCDLLRRVRAVCLEGYEHEGVPFEKLVERINPSRGLNRTPFFQVLFNVFNLPAVRKKLEGLTLEPLSFHAGSVRFDLSIHARETEQGLNVQVAYDTDLFSDARVAEMLEQYKYLLEQIVENPDQSIDLYSLVTLSAKRVLPDPTTPLDDTWHGAVHEFFACYARKQPDKLAVEDPQEAWTYRELNERSNQLAHYLIAHGIGREDIVAIYGRRSAGLVWALLGISKAGASFLVLDPAHPTRRVRDYLDISAPKGLIQITRANEPESEMEEVLNSLSLPVRITLPSLAIAKTSQSLSQYSKDDPAVKVTSDSLAYVIFTSGSTGKPKGVMGRHGPLTHFLPWLKETFGLSENDRFSFISGISTNKLQREIFTALTLGGTLYIPDVDDIGSFGRLDEWMRKKEISVVHLTPAMAQLLHETSREPIPKVRRVFFGGDLLHIGDVTRARKSMPNAEIVNFYNSSETQRGGSYITISSQRTENEKDIPPLGHGIKDVQLLVLNQMRQMAGIGEVGEICVRSPHMARGYLGDAELTKERFIINPFTGKEGDRIYRTGEQGRYLPNGNVEFVARSENQVSIRGFRVDVGEIESVLISHPIIEQAVVVGQESPSERLVAYYSVKKGHVVAIPELRDFLRTRLPNYMIPALFILLESMPLTPTGKVDRRALPVPAEDEEQIKEDGIYITPRTQVECIVADNWSAILGLKRISVHDNFFDLGGHSLLAIKVIAQLRKKFGVDVPVRTLFEAPTIAQLAARLERQTKPVVTYSHLIELRSGPNQKTIFCFPYLCGVQGEYTHFLRLAQYMAEYSFYGLQAKPAQSQTAPHATVEELAAKYVREIEEFQPDGPYYLIGDCAGATEAYETARQLCVRGKKVGLLVLLDARGPYLAERYWHIGPYSIRSLERLRSRLMSSREILKTATSFHWEESQKLTKGKRWPYLVAKALKMIRDPRWLLDQSSDETEDTLSASEEQLLECVTRARVQYRRNWPSDYRGKLAVIINKRWHGFDRTFGWAGMAAGGIETHAIPGNHISYMLEYVPLVADQLRACLEKAQKAT